MASEEQCLTELLKNAVDAAVESGNSRQIFSNDIVGLEEFLNASQPRKLREFYSKESSADLSEYAVSSDTSSSNVVVEKDVKVNYQRSGGLHEESGSCSDDLASESLESFGGWCGDALEPTQDLPAGENTETFAVISQNSSEGDSLDIADFEGLDVTGLAAAEKESLLFASPPENPETESSVCKVKESALSDNAAGLFSISDDFIEKKCEEVIDDISSMIGKIDCLDLGSLVEGRKRETLIGSDIYEPEDDLVLPLNDSRASPFETQEVDSKSPASVGIGNEVELIDLFHTVDIDAQTASPFEEQIVDSNSPTSDGIGKAVEIIDLFQHNRDVDAKTFPLMDDYLPHHDKDTLSQSAEGAKISAGFEMACIAPSLLDMYSNTNITMPNAQIIEEDFLLNLEIASSNSFPDSSVNLYNIREEESEVGILPPPNTLQEFLVPCSNEGLKDTDILNATAPSPLEFKSDVDVQCAADNDAKAPSDVENDSQIIPTLPLPVAPSTISERVDAEETRSIGAFDDIEFNLQNSPMLRRSRQTSDDKTRRDCRFIFGDDGSDDSDVTPTSQKPFVTLRDSLDIAKHAHLFESSDEELKSDEGKEEPTASSSMESSSSDSSTAEWKLPPYQSHHPCKTFTHKKKKTSIKSDKEKDGSRRVSFPEDDSRLITSYLEPVNPWYHMSEVSTDIISEAYRKSCERHKTRALPVVLQQIVALPVGVGVGGRIECLSIRNHKLDAGQCECLEEIFRRVQFHTLDFEACELDDDSAIPLFDMIEFYDSALQLNISQNNKIGNRGWQACARMMKRTPSLRILEARNTNLSEQNMPIICKALRCGTRLHTLHLENCNLTGRPLVNLVGALRLNDTITDLYLADNRLGANDSIQLGNLVRANKILKLLDVRNNNIQDSGCAHICNDIAEQQSSQGTKGAVGEEEDSGSSQAGLGTLVLWNNHITVHAVPYFSLMLHANLTLETLNLGRNNLTSEGVLLLKNSLMRNRCLKRLGLQATRIGNEGAVALAECIADNNNVISRIDLRENSIQVAGLLALSRSLKINSTVVQLDLDANPRAEPSPELSDQHLTLHHEIKQLCQRNQTNDHLKNASGSKEEKEQTKNTLLLSPEKRKISLTCETTSKNQEEKSVETTASESKRYRSPAPSPSVSPCPSPSLSPSPSPVPSPLKNRFKVCRVTEERGVFSSSFDLSSSNSGVILSTSAPAFLMHSSMSSSLPSLVPSARPNRFSGGGRFTVTKVQESSASSFKYSLPCNRAMSSPSLIALSDNKEDVAAPTIVVSSPNKAVRGFSVDAETDVGFTANHELKRNSSLDLPVTGNQNRRSSSSSDSSSPQDDVFIEESHAGSKEVTCPSSQTMIHTGTTYVDDRPPTPGSTEIIRAPLASIEAGSFDSDSEDSELTTQSSDSTHSDEVRIATEQTSPMLAWEDKGSGTASSKSIKDVLVNED